MERDTSCKEEGAASVLIGKVSTESPPPAQPMKISFQSSVSKFSIVLPAGVSPISAALPIKD